MKTYLITGATSGIGLATAQQLLSLGYRVVITGTSQNSVQAALQQLQASQQSNQQLLSCVYQAEQNNAAAQVVQFLQQNNIFLDGVFLNAGIFEPTPFLQVTPEQFDKTFLVNVKAVYFLLQCLVPLLNVNASAVLNSSLAVARAFAGGSVYTASKAAIQGLTQVLSVELAEQKLRVNCLQPGITLTNIQAKAGMTPEQIAQMAEQLKSLPMGNALQPQDTAAAAVYLLTDASSGVYGTVLAINGGYGL